MKTVQSGESEEYWTRAGDIKDVFIVDIYLLCRCIWTFILSQPTMAANDRRKWQDA